MCNFGLYDALTMPVTDRYAKVKKNEHVKQYEK